MDNYPKGIRKASELYVRLHEEASRVRARYTPGELRKGEFCRTRASKKTPDGSNRRGRKGQDTPKRVQPQA